MNSLEIRTNDTVLHKALVSWWQSYRSICPEGDYLLTDLDSVPSLGVRNEFTISRKYPADLSRPFSFEELEQIFEKQRNGFQKTRLTKRDDTFFLDGNRLNLSPLEQKILTLLFESKEPLSVNTMETVLFGAARASNQINVYIRYLRNKTDLPGRPPLILTVRGKGFYLQNG